MAASTSKWLARAGEAVALVYAFLVGGYLLLGAIRQGEFGFFVLSLTLIPWLAGPIGVAALLIGTAARPAVAAAFLALELLLLLASLWTFADAWIVHPGTPGFLILLTPLLQLLAIGLALIVAPFFGWRFRPDAAPGEA